HATLYCLFFFFQAEDGIRDGHVTGVQTCALPIFFIESLRTRKVELLAESEDTFAALNVSVKFKFLRSTDGKVIGFNRIVVERNDRPSPAESSEHASKISDQPLPFNKVEYTHHEVMIPVRDGIKLHAVILRPKDYKIGRAHV